MTPDIVVCFAVLLIDVEINCSRMMALFDGSVMWYFVCVGAPALTEMDKSLEELQVADAMLVMKWTN